MTTAVNCEQRSRVVAFRLCRAAVRFAIVSGLFLALARLVWWLATPAVRRAWWGLHGRQPPGGWRLETVVSSALATVAMVAGAIACAVVATTLIRELLVAVAPTSLGSLPTVGPARLRRVILSAFGISVIVPALLSAASATEEAPRVAGGTSVHAVDGLRLPDLPVPPRRTTAPTQTVVRPGDSLWSICADRARDGASDAQIASMVEDLYAANRRVIGDDPNLITTGTVLTLPGGPHDREH